ncbi:MAG: TIM barrel protein, partial [Bryobacteraceae bacterium]
MTAFPLALTATPAEVRSAPILLRGDLAGAFRIAAELGCAGLEIHIRHAADAQAGQLRRLMAEYGLAVPTLGTGMAATLDDLTLSHPDAATRRRALERLRGHVDLAAEIGSAVTIGSVSGRLGADETARGQRRVAALEALAELCHYAAGRGVTVLLEPLNRYECDYLNTLADAFAVAEHIAAPNLRVLADTFHMNIEESDMAAALAAVAPRLGHVHLADSNRQAPGRGHLDFGPVLAMLARLGYRGF